MPKFRVTSPDGKTYEVNAPEGATQEQAIEYIKSQQSSQPTPQQEAAPIDQPQAAPIPLWDKFKTGLGDITQGISQAYAHMPALDSNPTMADEANRIEQAKRLGPIADASLAKRETDWQNRRAASGDAGMEWMRIAGNIAASAPMMAAITPTSAAGSVLGAIGRGAAVGGINAGLQPVTSGDYGLEKSKQIALGGATGGAFSGIGYGIGKGVSALANKAAGTAEAPTLESIRNSARQSYKAAEDAGVVVKPEAFKSFVDELPGKLEGFRPRIAPKAADVIESFKDDIASGKTISLDALDELRQVASGAAKTMDRNEVRLISSIVDKLDEFVNNLKPEQIAAGNADEGVSALNTARETWRKFSKLRTVSDIVDIGENLNDANWTKNQFRAIVRKPRLFNQYSPEEQSVIKDIAKTGNTEILAKMIPWRGLQMAQPYITQIGQDSKITDLLRLISTGGDNLNVPNQPGLLGRGVSQFAPLLGGSVGSAAPLLLR